MNRRDFFSVRNASKAIFTTESPAEMATSVMYAPATAPRPRSGLSKFNGTWNYDTAAHLLRRTLFGPKKVEITLAQNLGLDATINMLFAPVVPPVPPLYQENETYSGDKQNLPWFTSTSPYNVDNRVMNLKGWWIRQLADNSTSVSQKMTLFWSNHLVTGTTTVNDARWSYEYIKLLQDNCLGNFKKLVKSISTNAAMLKYLSGNQNTKGSPNENYARELLELFTLGAVKYDGSINYTEDDVVAAAKILTGWRTDPYKNGLPVVGPWVSFNANLHDNSKKEFSSHFNNRVIQRILPTDYAKELDDLIDMIFARKEVALFVVREFYKWFVYYEVDQWVEDNIITTLANEFRTNGYEIKPIIKALLSSQHFYDMQNRGVMIKNPADFMIGMVRQFNVILNVNNRDGIYECFQLNTEMIRMQMDQLNPPNVAGWPEYYLAPNFYELWLNSATVQARNKVCDNMLKYGLQSEINGTYRVQKINKLLFVLLVSDGQAQDVNKVLDGTIQQLFPLPITDNQRLYLKDILVPGLPDFEWTTEWLQFLPTAINASDPKTIHMENKLNHFLYEIMSMAEFQMI